MEIISTGRGMGKTSTLIYMSSVTNIPIVVASKAMVSVVRVRAKDMGLSIPDPIVFTDLIGDNARGKKIPEKVYVDNLDLIVQSILNTKVFVATIDNEAITRQLYDCFM